MTHSLKIAVVSPARTSSGGAAFATNLVRELESVLDHPVATAQIPPSGSFKLPANVDDSDAAVFLGARAVRTNATTIFWPLNVAPLDESVNHLPHTSPRNRVRNIVLRRRLSQSVGQADALAFGSHYARSLYLARFPAAAPLPYQVIPGGTPSIEVSGRPEHLNASDRLILCCSHLYPYKGILQLVDALGAVRDQLPNNVRVRIAGADRDRTYATAVRRRIRAHGLADVIEVRGADAAELRTLYSSAEIAVFPSTCENAGSFSLFDGFHAGVPTVSSDRSSLPEMVRGAAILTNPHDSQRFGKSIVDLLSSRSEQARLRQQSLDWAASAPTWNTRARMLLDFVNELNNY